jgi:putative membrane protein
VSVGNIILRIIVNAIAIAITAAILPGIHVVNNDLGTYIVIGIVFGLVNAIVKPIVTLLTCPLVFLTLGLFILVINGLMLLLTASLVPERLTIDGFGWAIIGGIIMGVVGVVMEGALGLNKDE